MRRLLACQLVSTVALAAALPQAARAEPVAVRAEAQTLSVDCAGGDAEVGGNRNTVTFTGACRSLTLRGDANKVTIDLASAARLDIEGNGNTIRYSVGGGREPTVRVSGSNTDLASVGITPAPAPSADPVRLTGDNQRLELDCTGRDVDIQGNRSRYRLRGGCKSLTAHGEANTVQAELQPRAKVEIEGNGTVLSYSVAGGGADADIVVRGADSRAVRVAGLDAPPASAAPAVPAPPPVAAAPLPSPAPPNPAAAAPPSVPVLMHDLQGKVVASGTLVTFPAETLFDGGGSLRDGAGSPLGKLAALILQIHPSGVRVTASDPADIEMARQRVGSVQAWLAGPGQVHGRIQTDAARGTPPHVDVLILR
jgi:hypothetical protein